MTQLKYRKSSTTYSCNIYDTTSVSWEDYFNVRVGGATKYIPITSTLSDPDISDLRVRKSGTTYGLLHAAPIEYIGSIVGSNTSSDTINLNKPTNTINNDLMIVHITIRDSSDRITSAPSGWTLLNKRVYSTVYSYVYYKLYDSGDSEPYSWSLDVADNWSAGISSFRYVNTSSPIGNWSVQDNASTDATSPSITVQAAGNVVLHSSFTNYGTTITPPTGTPTYTEIVDRRSGTSSSDCSVHVSYATYTSTGATGTKTADLTTNTNNSAYHIELQR